MFLKSKIIQRILLLFPLLLFFLNGMAQDPEKGNAPVVTQGYNQLAIILIIIMIVLAFVIWGMGQILVVLGRQVLDKQKQKTTVIGSTLLVVFMLLSQISFAQENNEVIKVMPNYGGLSATTFYVFITVLIVEVVLILFMAFSIRRIYVELLPEKLAAVKGTSALHLWWTKMNKKLTRSVPLEKEADVMLDHDYDGIRELDNALPPWWKYGFIITICFAFLYLLNFHVLGYGKNPAQEYTAEMENARERKEIYEANNKDKVDEAHVPMADAAGLKEAGQIFAMNCVACHGKGGEGGAGPNLTDDYWLHKGSLNDVFQSIKHGYPDKGMQAWSVKFNPKEISLLASYIKSLRGTNPANAKAPQGDIFSDSATVMPVAGLNKAQ